jgi:hypothetical protein
MTVKQLSPQNQKLDNEGQQGTTRDDEGQQGTMRDKGENFRLAQFEGGTSRDRRDGRVEFQILIPDVQLSLLHPYAHTYSGTQKAQAS